MHDFVQALIRTSAFLRREIFEILRQPRLLITLVLGPFLILLIFGIGYRNNAPPVRTLFVLPEGSSITPEEIEEYGTTLGPSLAYAGMTRDRSEALEKLRQGEVEMVAIAPAQIYETLLSGKQAMFTLYHSELDPAQAEYVSYFSRIYIEEVNRRVLQRVALRGQQDARSIQARLREAKAQIAILRGALESNDIETARRQIALLLSASDELTTLTSAAGISLLDNLEQQLSPDEYHRAEAILEYVADFEERLQDLDSNLESAPTDIVNLEEVDAIEKDIDRLQAQLEEFTRIESYVLVKPFAIDTQNVAPLQPEVVEYFAPAVIVLLLQHLATSFASLSIVQEQSVGTMELFRVSPLSAGETLLGKYLSYMLFGGVVGMGLTLLLVLVLKIPMLGSWG
ncbi:MAG: ABC transporter permease, partial [Anaerolineae bacterium]